MEIVMFIGIPATGKSSFYQERFAASHLRINRDMLKTVARTSSLFEWCLERKQSCVIDNTNTTRAVRSRWIRSAREKGIPVIGYFFESKLDGALERNSQREGVAGSSSCQVPKWLSIISDGEWRTRDGIA